MTQHALMCSNVCEQCTLHVSTNKLLYNGELLLQITGYHSYVGMTIQISTNSVTHFNDIFVSNNSACKCEYPSINPITLMLIFQ